MRQLSAAEERKIDETMQLASTFARLTTTHHDNSAAAANTPRSTCSGSSKESLDSPGPGAATGGGHVFRFAGLRRRVTGKEERRTFVDGLSLTCNATDIFTPDAQVVLHQSAHSSAYVLAGIVCGLEMSGNIFFNPIPSHSQWLIPIPIPNPEFSLVLFPFPFHSHWLFPFTPAPIPVLLVLSRSDNK